MSLIAVFIEEKAFMLEHEVVRMRMDLEKKVQEFIDVTSSFSEMKVMTRNRRRDFQHCRHLETLYICRILTHSPLANSIGKALRSLSVKRPCFSHWMQYVFADLLYSSICASDVIIDV